MAVEEATDLTFAEFLKVEIRVGTVTRVEAFPEARHPAYKLWIDFGAKIGTRKTSARLTERYDAESLTGRQVAVVINFPPKQIGPFMSEVLVLGFPDENGAVTLIAPDGTVPNGARLF